MSYKNISFGKVDEFNVIVEIPQGSKNKYELNEQTGEIELDWVFTNDFCFPFNYGFIPQTKGGDGDCLDAFVLSSHPVNMRTVVKCRAIGVIKLIDRGEQDDKIIAIALADTEYNKHKDISELTFDYKTIFTDFFKELGIQKNKVMKIEGFEGGVEALKELNKAKIS